MKWKQGFYSDGEAPEGASEMTDENYAELLAAQSEGLTIVDLNGVPVLADYRPNAKLQSVAAMRSRRDSECFPIVNRGQLWYSTLSESQKAELAVWYQAWLDAPQTGVVPAKPAWL